MIHEFQREVRDQDLAPHRAAELLTKLTALIGNCNAELTEADLIYKSTLLMCMSDGEPANRARIKAETSAEYRRMREAKDARELCIELVRSLKAFLRNSEEEMRLSR